MFGTTSWRLPSSLRTSIARPRLTCSGDAIAGLPSISAKDSFISPASPSALTIAYPIRWVNETFPPRPRARWLLITIRLSIRSLAGIPRTLVAVGTTRLAAMFAAVLAAAPRSRTSVTSAASASAAPAALGLSRPGLSRRG